MIKLLRNNWEILLIVLFLLLTVWPTLSGGYFSHHDDLHVIRILEMRKCFADLQIPCRWVPDMGQGYGYPLFNYYNPFIYYLGATLSFVFGYVGAAKALFLIALVLGPIGMYLLGKELYGKIGGVVASTLFIFAPYRAVDAYVRGALSELFAISLIPFIFLFIYRVIKGGNRADFVGLTLTTGIFLTTHNVSVVIWGPFLVAWCVYFLVKEKLQNIKLLIVALLLGFGLSAFFFIPAFLEKDLVSTETLISADLNYNVHFAGVRQLFLDRFWGYGASKQGPYDDMSLQIGWPYWWVVVAAFIAAIVKKSKLALLLTGFFAIGAAMTHNKSAIIWDNIHLLAFLQFPWRFLAVTVFSASLLSGYVVKVIKDKYKYIVLVLILSLTVVLNWNYFKPGKFFPTVNDETKLTGDLWEEQRRGAIFDYLPTTAVDPKGSAPTIPEADSRSTIIKNFNVTSDSWNMEVTVLQDSVIEVPVFNFPNWEANFELTTNQYGRILVHVPAGDHVVIANFKNTPVRSAANLISIFSLVILALGVKYAKGRKTNN